LADQNVIGEDGIAVFYEMSHQSHQSL